MNDPHAVLGVTRRASQQAIRRAYLRLAFDNHPDRNGSPEAAARFQEVQEAYELLSGTRPPPEVRPSAEEIAAFRREVARRAYQAFVDHLSGNLGAGPDLDVGGAGVRIRIKIGGNGRG